MESLLEVSTSSLKLRKWNFGALNYEREKIVPPLELEPPVNLERAIEGSRSPLALEAALLPARSIGRVEEMQSETSTENLHAHLGASAVKIEAYLPLEKLYFLAM